MRSVRSSTAWDLHPRPIRILDLEILDPAMGSGAFLVEACRQLARKLVEAWHAHGGPPAIPPGEGELLHARRLLEPLGHNPLAILPPAAFEAHYSHQLHEAAMAA